MNTDRNDPELLKSPEVQRCIEQLGELDTFRCVTRPWPDEHDLVWVWYDDAIGSTCVCEIRIHTHTEG